MSAVGLRVLLEAARELWTAGLAGVVVSCLPILALLSLVLVPLAWQKAGRVVPAPVVAQLSMLGAALLCAGLLVRRERIGFVRAALHLDAEDPTTKARWLASYLSNELNAELMAGVALVIAVPILGSILGARWARRATSGPAAIAATASFAAPLCMLGACLVVHVLSLSWGGCGMSQSDRYEMMMGSYGVLAQGRWVIFGAAAVGTIALLIAGLGVGRTGGLRSTIAGAALLALGAAAWFATRGHAYDAEHPLQFVQNTWPEGSLDRVATTHASQCTPASDGVLVLLDERGFSLDGMVEPGPYELEDNLRKKRELWLLLNPGRTFPGIVLFSAPPETPVDRMVLMIAAARRAGYANVRIVLALPVQHEFTRTLGTIERSRVPCEVPLPQGSAWNETATWGDLAK
jgi:hypothetical protein